MSELKTLKNMSFRDDGSLTEKDIPKLYLKDEAIKWIKELEKGFNSKELHIDCNGNKGMLTWIKHFFDITDEDLK